MTKGGAVQISEPMIQSRGLAIDLDIGR